MIEPINAEQRQLVLQETEHFRLLAEQLMERKFPAIPVLFDLKGTTAGMFKSHGKQHCIRYNPWIFAKYFQENMAGTVPHEVAHYVVRVLYPRGRVKPHGPEWQAVMTGFGADNGVTFDLDLAGIPQRRQRTHSYRCDCREHQVSSTRHNRAQRGAGTYLCRYCSARLVYVG
jgi:SprT protein